MTSISVVNTPISFISVMTPATTSGTLTLQLTSYDSSEDVDLTLALPVPCGMTEKQLASSFEDELLDQLEEYLYDGLPVFSSQEPDSIFRIDRSDHVISIWSQTQFEVTVTSNTSNALINVSTTPRLTTIEYFRDYADAFSVDLTNDEGDELTDFQLDLIIGQYSRDIIAYLGFNVVLATYLNMFLGTDQKFVNTSPNPGVTRDPVLVKSKSRGYSAVTDENGVILDDQVIVPTRYPLNVFIWNRQTGKFVYTPNSQLIKTGLPWAKENEAILTIRAGFRQIPESIQTAMVRLFTLDSTGEGNFKLLAGGSARIELENPNSLYSKIYTSIKGFKG